MLEQALRVFKGCEILRTTAARTASVILMLLGLAAVALGASGIAAASGALDCVPPGGWTRLSGPESSTSESSPGDAQAGILTVAAAEVRGDVEEVYVGGRRALYRGNPCNSAWATIYEPPMLADGVPLLRPILSLASSVGGRVYFGSVLTHPLHVSDDGGQTWRVGGLVGEVGSLLGSPSDPDVAYIFGLNSGAMSDARSFRRSVFRTSDGGRTWAVQTRDLPDGSPVVDPIHPDVIYLIGQGRVLRSSDGAVTFAEHGGYQSDMTSVHGGLSDSTGRATATVDGRLMWFIETSGGMYVSRDQGVSWLRDADVPFGGPVRSLTASLQDPSVLYAVARGDELWAYRERGASPTPNP